MTARDSDHHRGRYELKFPVLLSTARRFLDDARPLLDMDEHGRDGVYRVSSLYYDSETLGAYWEKLDGEARRRKFRLRYYSAAHPERVEFQAAQMEIKHRLKSRVFKDRLRLTPEGAERLLSGQARLRDLGDDGILRSDDADRAVVDAIARADMDHDLTPVNIITYLREAWVGDEGSRLRVTIDREITAYRAGCHSQVATDTGNLLVPDTMGILEVKFDHAIPRTIRDLLHEHGLRLQRFSKYAAGVEAPGVLAPELVPVWRSRNERANPELEDVLDSSATEPREQRADQATSAVL